MTDVACSLFVGYWRTTANHSCSLASLLQQPSHHEYKKGFYNDIHDLAESIVDRIRYCLYHLVELDFVSAVWVHLSHARVLELQAEDRIMKDYFGFKFVNNQGQDMCEIHVDEVESSCLLPELQGVEKGGILSIRMPEESMEHIEWGHDEVVAHEKALRSRCWHGSNGEVPLRPKDLGTSRHLSAMFSRMFGWNPVISEDELTQVNANRQGTKYIAEEQAIKLYGSAEKEPLSSNEGSFYWSMRPGANNDGYWNLACFVVQLENLIDVCDVLYPGYQHVISLDHSNNHGGKRVGGLDSNTLNVSFGGAQPIFSPSILNNDSCLGQHPKGHAEQLDVGDTQRYTFEEGDSGPYHMTPEQQVASKYDIDTGKEKITNLTKAQLIASIAESNNAPDNLDRKRLPALRAIAERMGLPTRTVERKITQGWIGKAKGLLQLCWERRLIEFDAPKGVYNKAQLKEALEQCHDFKTEVSLVEFVARQRGWLVIFSPKAHPEVAGVGIEYIWAACKNWLHMVPLEERKGRDNFDRAFHECFGRGKLVPSTVRGCARAARQYMQAYVLAHSEQLPSDQQAQFEAEDLKKCVAPVTLAQIEKLKKQYKCHRSVADITTQGGEVRAFRSSS